MNKSMKNAQSGFTLIELIVVIVILGILAATALPKFANLGGDARLASLNAAKGALSSTAAMAHGRYMANTSATPLTKMTVEGIDINYPVAPATLTGYPKAETALATAAGLTDDGYKVYGPNHANDANSVSTAADEIMIVPNSVSNTPSGLKCYVKYKEAASGQQPTITVGATTAADCE